MAKLRTPLATVLAGVETTPDRDILTFVDFRDDGGYDEETRSFRELLENGRRMAGAFTAAGMAEGQSFAIIMRNHPEFVDAMIASEIAGTIFVPIDPRLRGDRLIYMLRFAECRGAIVTPDMVAVLRPLLGRLPDLRWIWILGASPAEPVFSSLESVMASARPSTRLEPRPLDGVMQMLYTSGTTGDPKAIRSPYARFANIAALGPQIGLEPDDRPYTGLSLTHANAQLITLGSALGMGLPLVISRQFSKSRLWPLLAHYGCTTFNLLGGMATAILAEPPGPFDRENKVRFVLSAGMPLGMWKEFEERFGLRIFEVFGAAEGGFTLNPPGVGPMGSIGKSQPGSECAILDEEGQPCGPHVLGEICFRPTEGAVAPVTYFRNPEASAQKTRGGWMHTGDIGYADENGWLFFAHRSGDGVRRNGEFVNIGDIESAIATIAGVADVHLYGIATATCAPGEKAVCAAVVRDAAAPVDPLSIFEDCRMRLGAGGIPDFVQIVPEIPKTASEKPQDRYLIDLIGQAGCSIFNKSGITTITRDGA